MTQMLQLPEGEFKTTKINMIHKYDEYVKRL